MTAREFRKGEILTTRGGQTWRVDRVYTNDTGRGMVGLVNPFNPNHGTAFYADALPGCLADRPAPPPLCTTLPPCSVCGKEVTVEDGEYVCFECGCSWTLDSLDETPGTWNDEDATQCTAVLRPFADRQDPGIRENTYRCVLDADHLDEAGSHYHENPAYGFGWRDSDQRAIPAEQPVEATS